MAVDGRVGSEHNVGVLWVKGLKFCSAWIKSCAAFTASAPVPSEAMILSPVWSFVQGLAAARRFEIAPPAIVAA